MRNKPWYSVLLIVGLVFLLASSVIGCSQTETWTTYYNPTYGYTIDYPQNWDLDTSGAPIEVYIDSPLWCIDCPVCTIGIVGMGEYGKFWSTDEMQSFMLNWIPYAFGEDLEDVEIISSRGVDGKWKWITDLAFTYPDIGMRGRARVWIGETLEHQFILICISTVEDWSECEEIAETFIP